MCLQNGITTVDPRQIRMMPTYGSVHTIYNMTLFFCAVYIYSNTVKSVSDTFLWVTGDNSWALDMMLRVFPPIHELSSNPGAIKYFVTMQARPDVFQEGDDQSVEFSYTLFKLSKCSLITVRASFSCSVLILVLRKVLLATSCYLLDWLAVIPWIIPWSNV